MSEQQSSCAAPVEKSDAVEYRIVPGFPAYRVGSDGTVWCCLKRGGHERILTDNWRSLRLVPGKNGYLQVSMYDANGQMATKKVHRLVIETFVSVPPHGAECCHANGINTDNRLCNLRWDSHVGNEADRQRHGNAIGPRGEKAPHAKLTWPAVRRIRHLAAQGASRAVIAHEYGVSQSNVDLIVTNKTWKE